MSGLQFTKMHGIGNDYIYVNVFEQRVSDPGALARAISDRHTGVGGDGLILILPPEREQEADVRMRMFNADGSESEMCGNGVRCVCKYAHDHGLSRANPMRVQTGAGVLSITYSVNGSGLVTEATVDMGEPILELERIPVDAGLVTRGRKNEYVYLLPDIMEDEDGPQPLPMVFVSMGNPHAVTYCEPLETNDLLLGSVIEHHPAFPNRINVHFVSIESPKEVTVLHWERGSGPTKACGTGACAVCVAGVLTGLTEREILAHLPGGDLRLHWDETTNHVFMTGPAVEVFTGELNGYDDAS